MQQKSRNVRELDATREVARLDLKLAQETVATGAGKIRSGKATLREIEQARLDESDKWVAFLDADFARQQAQLTLLQATGQLAKVSSRTRTAESVGLGLTGKSSRISLLGSAVHLVV